MARLYRSPPWPCMEPLGNTSDRCNKAVLSRFSCLTYFIPSRDVYYILPTGAMTGKAPSDIRVTKSPLLTIPQSRTAPARLDECLDCRKFLGPVARQSL